MSTKEGTCQMEKNPHKYDTGVSLTVLDKKMEIKFQE